LINGANIWFANSTSLHNCYILYDKLLDGIYDECSGACHYEIENGLGGHSLVQITR
jgi:hypothetical protein